MQRLGKERKEHTMKLKVLAGIDDGSTLKLSGQGISAIRSLRDLLLPLVSATSLLEGTNIYDLKVNFAQLHSVPVDIPTLYGDEKQGAPGSQRRNFTLKGKGIQHLRRTGRSTGQADCTDSKSLPGNSAGYSKNSKRALPQMGKNKAGFITL